MKDNISAILSLVIAILLLFIFVQNSCTRENEGTTTVTPRSIPIPEIIKIPDLPNLTFEPFTETKTTPEYIYVAVPQKPDTTLLSAYRKEIDSLKKELLYADAVTVRSYEASYEDENIEMKLFAETTGKLNKLQLPFYKIKKKEVFAEDKETIRPPNFSLYLGSELGIPTSFDNGGFAFKGNVFLQSKNMMYNASYDTDKRVWAGLAIKL